MRKGDAPHNSLDAEIYFYNSLFNKNLAYGPLPIQQILKHHPLLFDELIFFQNIMVQREDQNSKTIPPDLLLSFFGNLGGLYSNLNTDRINYLSKVGIDFSGDNHYWIKLAICIFYEQEKVSWHSVSCFAEAREQKKFYQHSDASVSVEELKLTNEKYFDSFIEAFAKYISKSENIFDTLNTAICETEFFERYLLSFINESIESGDGVFDKAEHQFPSILVYYTDGQKPRRVTTEPPDPIFDLNRTVYRSNSPELVNDCTAVLKNSAAAKTKLKIHYWLRPLLKYIFLELDLEFSRRTRAHHRIEDEVTPKI